MMITFARGPLRFNYRVVGIAINDGRVLLHRAETDDFWALPGGRAELMEPASVTLQREMQEELGIEVQVLRLLWLVENFFEYNEERFHELALYFLMEIPDGRTTRRTSEEIDGVEQFWGEGDGNLRLIFRWFDVADLEQVRLFPSFLRQGLKDLPTTPVHVVHWDSE